MKKIILAFFILGLTTFGATKSHKDAAMELLEVSEVKKTTDSIVSSYDDLIENQFNSLKLNRQGKKAAEIAKRDTKVFLNEMLNWDEMSKMYVEIYTEVFTEEEIRGLTKFYKSDLGKKLIRKMPLLMEKSMNKTQEKLARELPKFQEKLRKNIESLNKEYGK